MLRSSIAVTMLAVLASAFGFLNQLALAYRFGTSRAVATYMIAMSTAAFTGGFAASMISFSVPPRIVRASVDSRRHAEVVQTMFVAIGAMATIGILCGWMLTPLLVKIGGDAFVDGDARFMARLGWLSAGFQVVVAFLGAVCNAREKFSLPMIAGLLPYLSMMGATFLLGPAFGIVVVPAGLATGTLLAGLVLLWDLRHVLFQRLDGALSWNEVRSFVLATPLAAISMFGLQVIPVVDASLAPFLGAQGLATLGYSQRILIALGTFAIIGPSAVLVPSLSRRVAAGQFAAYRRETWRGVAIVLLVTMAMAFAGSFLSRSLVALAFQRGAFGEEATRSLSEVLTIMLIGLAPMSATLLLFRSLFCLGNGRLPAILAMLWGALYWGLGSLLSPARQALGMAWAYALAWGIVFTLAMVLFPLEVRWASSRA